MRRCDRCGKETVDAIGARQASLFDLPEADPRATPEALAELRAGRILCLACQRTPELFASPFVAKRDPIPLRNLRPGESESFDGWTATRTATGGFAVVVDDPDDDDDGEPDGGPKDETTAEILDELDEDEAEAAELADAVADLDDDDPPERWSAEDHARAFGPGHHHARGR